MKPKISPTFRARLDGLPPDTRIRAVVVLDTSPPARTSGKRLSSKERQALAQAVQEAAGKVLGQLDRVLESAGGKRLQAQPNVLGTVLVETTVAGVEELAREDTVKGVMEDQEINLLTPQMRSPL